MQTRRHLDHRQRVSSVRKGEAVPTVLPGNDLLTLQRFAGNAAVAKLLKQDRQKSPKAVNGLSHVAGMTSVQRWPTRKEIERRSLEPMGAWMRLPDKGARKHAAIEEPYVRLLDLLDGLNVQLESVRAVQGKSGKQAFEAFLTAAFSDLRAVLTDLAIAEIGDDLKGVINFVFAQVENDERATRWLFEYEDILSLMWDNQYEGKTYRRCFEIAKSAGPLYSRGYHTDRAFIGKGHLPPAAPEYGDKLHLSVDDYSYSLVRDEVLPYLGAHGYVHKIVADVADLTGKQRGKVVTIYPKFIDSGVGPMSVDSADLSALADHLADMTAHLGLLPGPPVKTDVPWKDSRFVYLEKNAQLKPPRGRGH